MFPILFFLWLSGITGGELEPCEGYVAKLQSRAAKGLRQFREDLELLLITRKVIYWDDTVIMVLTQRDCQKNSDDTCHKWSSDLKGHISRAIKDHNDAIAQGRDSFGGPYIEQFYKKENLLRNLSLLHSRSFTAIINKVLPLNVRRNEESKYTQETPT